MGKLSDDPKFNELVRKAMEKFNSLSPKEQAEHRQAQRVSWVYGEMRLAGHDVTREQVAEMIKKRDEEENPDGGTTS